MTERSATTRSGASHEQWSDLSRLANQLKAEIQGSTHPAILTHAMADADAVGSVIATKMLCEALDRPVNLATSGDGEIPANLEYVADGIWTADQLESIDDTDLLIFVDCAEAERSNPAFELSEPAISSIRWINIDHHVTNTRFGHFNIVVPQAAATCEILVQVFDQLQIPFQKPVATAMLSGIYGDTLGLKTPSTRPSTMRACAALIEAGADLDLVVDKQFRMKPYSSIKLWAEMFQTVAWRGKLIWAYVNPAMLKRSKAEASEAEGFVNHIAGTIGALASALLYEEEGGWRVSMRSPHLHVDVAEICNHFGGGGHPRAAGCRLPPGADAREAFLDEVARMLAPLPIIERSMQSSNGPE